MALESQPSGVIFWVACNTTVTAGTISFIHKILSILQRIAHSQNEKSRIAEEVEISDLCIEFNLKRIKTYQTRLQPPLKKCLKALGTSRKLADKPLADWLRSFQGFDDDLTGLCRFSYQQRSSPYIRELRQHIGDEISGMTKDESRKQDFLLARHYIGRLGSHLKAAKILTAAGWRMPELFDNFDIRIRPSPKAPSFPPPTDGLTTLEGIIKRMLPAQSNEIERYQEALAVMDNKFQILDRLQAQFTDKDFKPRVHAELNLLEYLYNNRIPFVGDDRFIGCSKPACYCCYHYISLHPGGFVRPSSHGIRYLNWRLPDPIDDTNLEEERHRRVILNKLIAQIRLDALRQIDQCRGPSPWHPDSTTGITNSFNHNGGQIGFRVHMSTKPVEELTSETLGDYEQQSESLAATESILSDSLHEDESSDSDGGVQLHVDF
ncbi:Uncharacterized protein BP5553_08508 [Venustampulla echinocandica]|uniref:Uncharacterized protein n=1 Tax=Venustampulla echinocandica TaxID=2656787 RepID=A0A370TEE9_9HELO|nr:Uncharacterized protein BP5553_08508 [Venustampulla echinocandica]RDL33069.1 Uncharacterized protein BP5553_08508 [Venustampulla echinocandica]